MPVRLKPKDGERTLAEVPQDVLSLIVKMRDKRKKEIESHIADLEGGKGQAQPGNSSNSYRRISVKKQLEVAHFELSRLTSKAGGDILSGVQRGGIEEILFRMRRLPYVRFDLKSRVGRPSGKKQNWIIGLTQDVFTDLQSRRSSYRNTAGGRYYHGKYYIAILSEDLGTTNQTFHLMPQRNPTTQNRHMHHHTQSSVTKNPLDATPNTCYGGFSGTIAGAFRNADVPELFRILHIFTERLNPNSPLINLSQLSHIQMVKSDG
jgi:hypothetical protein